MSIANLNSRLKNTIATVKNGTPTAIQQEVIYNLTEDLALGLDSTLGTPMSQEDRAKRMDVAKKQSEVCTIYNKTLLELKDAAMKGDPVAGHNLSKAEFECKMAKLDYTQLFPKRNAKHEVYEKVIRATQSIKGGKKNKTKKLRKTKRSRKHRK